MASSKRFTAPLLVLLATVAIVGCSSAPDPPEYEVETKNRASQLAEYGNARFEAGDYEMARRFFEEALRENISVDHLPGIAKSHNSLSRVYAITGNVEQAAERAELALEFARIADDREQEMQAHVNLGEVALRNGETDAARAALEEAQRIAEEQDEPLDPILLHNLGTVYAQSGDLDQAETYFDQARSANEEAGNWRELASNYYMLASIASRQNDFETAQTRAESALESDKRAEHAPGIAADLFALGKIRARRDDDNDAYQYYLRSLRVYLAVNDARGSAEVLAELETTAARLGKDSEAEEFGAQRQRILEAIQ
ncbi:MAG TPA: tetratricopeptide repeat protein [Alkalispirochaeta sp.]|nr:tetratricopeptide repeat protein [Alkalispirochaeta sp.]